MAKISHYPRGGLNVYFTQKERALIGTARCNATVNLKSDREFIRIIPDNGGRYSIAGQPKNKRHPWRIQLPTQALPPFGVESVASALVADGVIAIARPTIMGNPMTRMSSTNLSPEIRQIERVISKHRKTASSNGPNTYQHLNLRQLIEALNVAWGEIGGELEISVDQNAHRVTARHMVEY